jgi:hypothetical protein
MANPETRWKFIGLFIVGGVLGVSAGFMLGVFFYPFIFLADITAMEKVSGRAGKQVVAEGRFVHANPSDPVHYGKGRTTVFAGLVHLEPDFEVGPGPRFHVYLSPKADVKSNGDFDEAKSLDLGRLKAFKGSQSYPIPAGTNIKGYKSIVIWCKAFSVLVSPATLKFAGK